jgi:hypothetical protein
VRFSRQGSTKKKGHLVDVFQMVVDVMTVIPSDGPWMVGVKVSLHVMCWLAIVMGGISLVLRAWQSLVGPREAYSMRKLHKLELEEAIRARNECENKGAIEHQQGITLSQSAQILTFPSNPRNTEKN